MADAEITSTGPEGLTNIRSIPTKKTLMLINNFITNTADFMNKFAVLCERKLAKIALNTQKLEITLELLEAKLESVPWLEDAPAGASAAAAAAPMPAAPAAAPAAPTSSLPPPPPPPGTSLLPPPPPPPGMSTLPPPPNMAPAGTVATITATTTSALPPPPPPASTDTALVPVASNATPVKDDPRFSKFYMMLKVGIPPPAVKIKMSQEGLDPNVLDMDPDAPAPPGAPPAAADRALVPVESDDE